MRLIQVTLLAGATPITPNVNAGESLPIYVSALVIQNNAAGGIRVGDNTVVTGRGIALAAAGILSLTFNMVRGSLLSQWYLVGTPGQIIDVLYETAQ